MSTGDGAPAEMLEPTVAFTKDADGRFRYVNPAARDLLALRVGQSFAEALPGADIDLDTATDEIVTTSGESTQYVTVVPVDGDDVRLLVTKLPLGDGGVGGVGIDLDPLLSLQTEIEQLRRRMSAQLSNLEAEVELLAIRNDDLDSFAHAAAHELQSPLRSIIGFSALAREHLTDDDATTEHLRRIEAACTRMSAMVDSLLHFASAGTPGPTHGEVCDLDEIVRDVLVDQEPAIEAAGARIEVGPLGSVSGDATSLRQIMSNLLSNAVKYNDGQPRVTVTGETVGDFVLVSVTDNGIGFDAEHASRVFEPFQRLHSGDGYGGSGVGLAICKRLVQRLGGEIWATSAAGEGTTMQVLLPTPLVDLRPERDQTGRASESNQ